MLTTEQVGRLLGVNPSTVRRLASEGAIPAHKAPGVKGWRFLADELVAWLRAQPGGSPPSARPEGG